MEDSIEELADESVPAPVRAALSFLDYCRCRQIPINEWGEATRVEQLDLDEMRARQSALGALSRYFNAFAADPVADVLDDATAAIRAADAMRSQQPGG